MKFAHGDRLIVMIVVLVLALLAGGEARAQLRFNGSTDTKWVTADNWTPAAVPTATSNVVIGTTNTAVGAGGSPMTATIGSGENCLANSLTLGELPFNSGTLNMTGGTLTFPAAGGITVAGAASSTGTLNQIGGTLAGITSGDLSIAAGSGGKGTVVLGGSTAITSTWTVASGTNSDGTLVFTNSAQWKNGSNAGRTVGSAAGAIGRLGVYSNAMMDFYSGSNVRNLTLGSLAGSTGEVTVADSGSISNINVLTVGDYGVGTLTVRDSGKIQTLSCYIGGTNNGGAVTVRDNGTLYGPFVIGTRAGASGTLIVTNNARTYLSTPTASSLGNAAGAAGYLYVHDTAVMNFYSGQARSLTLGSAAGGTGVVEMTGGAITNVSTLTVGSAGYGSLTVGGGGVWAEQIDVGSTNNNSRVVVKDTGRVVSGGSVRIGALAGASGTLTVTNGGTVAVTYFGANDHSLVAGYADASEGRINVCGGTLAMTSRNAHLGVGVGSTGILEITSGVFSNAGGAYVFTFGATTNAVGELVLRGGTLYSLQNVAFGAAAGAVGRALVTGGDWRQIGALGIGTTAGGTGLVNVANCVSTNITGAVTVGGGSTVGDRYGSITISNATFGGGTRVMVLTNGFVELTGTGSVFTCNSFTNNGGVVTNHVRQFAGGLDIRGAAGTALVVTNGGRMHLSFEEDPVGAGDFWGLRWAGNNHAGQLQAMRDSGALTWSDAALYPSYKPVGIYTNATDTFVGVYVQKTVPRGMMLMVK